MEENKKKSRSNKNKKILIYAIIIFLVVVFIIIKNNTIKKNYKTELIVSNENITDTLKNEIIIKENVVYLSLEDVQKYFDKDLYQEDNKIILTSTRKIAAIELNKNEIEINGSKVKIQGKAYKTENNIIYLPISDLKNVYDMECTYNLEYQNITIDYKNKKIVKANTTKNVLLKEKPGIFASNLEKIDKDSLVVYISEENGWAKIRSQNGNIGYINKAKLTNIVTEREDFIEQKQENTNVSFEQDITSKNIKKYKNRNELIEKILIDAVSKKQKAVKIIYKKDKNSESFKRFIIEATAILKECGISVVIEK